MDSMLRKSWANLIAKDVEALWVPRFYIDTSESSPYGSRLLEKDEMFLYDWHIDDAEPLNTPIFINYRLDRSNSKFKFPDEADYALDLIPQKFVITLDDSNYKDRRSKYHLLLVEIKDNPDGKWLSDRVFTVTAAGVQGAITEKISWRKGGPDRVSYNESHTKRTEPALYVALTELQNAYCGAHNRMLVDSDSLGGKPTKAKPLVFGAPTVKYTKVDLSAPVVSMRVNLGGTHASPRWHMRRGHWRTYKSGKRVWVEQMEVGDKSKGVIVKDYVINSQGANHA